MRLSLIFLLLAVGVGDSTVRTKPGRLPSGLAPMATPGPAWHGLRVPLLRKAVRIGPMLEFMSVYFPRVGCANCSGVPLAWPLPVDFELAEAFGLPIEASKSKVQCIIMPFDSWALKGRTDLKEYYERAVSCDQRSE